MVGPMKYFVILAMLLLMSCSMSPEEIALENQRLTMMNTALNKPTLRCEQGCEYTDPRRNLSVMFPTKTNGWDFANKVLGTVTTIAPWVAVSKIAVDGLAASGNNTTNNDSYNSSGGNETNGAIDNSTTTGAVSTDSNDNNSTVNTDSNDDNSTTDSNDNNSTSDSNDDNSVVTPTVEPTPAL